MATLAPARDNIFVSNPDPSPSLQRLKQTEKEISHLVAAVEKLTSQNIDYQKDLNAFENSVISALMQRTEIDTLRQYCKGIRLAPLREIGIEVLSDIPFRDLDSLDGISTQTAESIVSATSAWVETFPWESLSSGDAIIVSNRNKMRLVVKRMAIARVFSVLKNQAKNLEELTNQANSLQKTMLEYMLQRNVFWRKKKRKAAIDAHLTWQKFPEEWKVFAKECEKVRLKETLSSKEAVEYILQHQDDCPAVAMSLINTFLLKKSSHTTYRHLTQNQANHACRTE